MAYCFLPTSCVSTTPILLLPASTINPIRTSKHPKFSRLAKCKAVATSVEAQSPIVRREANYHPAIWGYDYIQSLTSIYHGDAYKTRADKLKEEVRMMIKKVEDPLSKLELVDTLQRLSIFYHFEEEIKEILESIYNNYSSDGENNEDLYATSLTFRLLRQHYYDFPQDVFNKFMDENGKFKAYLSDDTYAMLCLYEASYLSTTKDKILDEARDFTSKHLKDYLNKNNEDDNFIAKLVSHALEVPLHWRVARLEARWFIDMYQKKRDMNSTFLQLAKLDFNMVQAIHLEDLKYASRWWKATGLGENLSFARDRLMANYIWTVELNFQPHLQYCRRMNTMVYALITTIDDIYDVYGTLDELKIFTDVIESWDANAINVLPDYMKISCLALFNSINDMAYDTLKEQNFNIIPYVKKMWADLCKTYLVEASWYHNSYKPTLEEYLENAWISISAPTIATHIYALTSNSLTNDAFEYLEKYPNLVRWISIILRLANDLGTSKDELKRGDTLKSVQCYMHETGVSEEKAREHIHYLISETWKKVNEERSIKDSRFNQTFVDTSLNIARMAQCMYQHGDGHGIENRETKDRVLSLLIDPIPLE